MKWEKVAQPDINDAIRDILITIISGELINGTLMWHPITGDLYHTTRGDWYKAIRTFVPI